MPSLSEHKTDPEREYAFRQGYLAGASAVISGLVHLLPEDDKKKVDMWFVKQLGPWGADRSQAHFNAPDFPRID